MSFDEYALNPDKLDRALNGDDPKIVETLGDLKEQRLRSRISTQLRDYDGIVTGVSEKWITIDGSTIIRISAIESIRDLPPEEDKAEDKAEEEDTKP